MDLTFQVPVQYCSLQYWTLLLSLVPSTTGCYFCFVSVSLFFLELFIHWSPVHNWVLFLLCLCLFILSGVIYPLISSNILGTYWPTIHGVLKAQILKWFAILFSSGPHLSELSTMTCQSWVALHGMAHSFFELDKAVVHVVRLVSFLSIDLIFFLHFFIDISLLQVWQCKSIRKIFSIRKPWFSLEWIFLYFLF